MLGIILENDQFSRSGSQIQDQMQLNFNKYFINQKNFLLKIPFIGNKKV